MKNENEKMDFSKWMVRSSAMGKIVSKSGKLIIGNKTYLREQWVQEKRGIRKEIASKYFKKGNLTEQAGLGMLNRNFYPDEFLKKNDEQKENGFTKGTCDTIAPDGTVYDNKSAYDWWTFSKAELTPVYEWQIKAYCWLWGTDFGRLFYSLTDMPDEILDDEARKLFYAGKFPDWNSPDYEEAKKDLRKKYLYEGTSELERFKIWDIELKVDDVNRMKEAVKLSRIYLQELETEHHEMIKRNNLYGSQKGK